ncbi:glutathione transferase GST 23-like [Curcuma longa]|uniref:glutathione transferase GST 23-like n=1 Tax=Curcuma longa TaxID=136217 RepID=UPI003D9F7DC3
MDPAGGFDLELLGSWADSHTHRVQLALKLKGLPFEYREEDSLRPSAAVLLHNPVYGSLPVLLHRGRALLHSVVILQYLDEAWPSGRLLLPSDPCDRAAVRFWSHFADDKLAPSVAAVFSSCPGDGRKAAVDQVHQNLKLLERELGGGGAFEGRRFFGGDEIGLLDVVLGCGSYWLAVFEEVMEVKLVDPEAFPRFHAWLRDFEEQREVKETIPPIDKLLEYATAVRQMMLGGTGADDDNVVAVN